MSTSIATYPEIDALLHSEEPSIRWKVRVGVLGEAPDSPEIIQLQLEIKSSALVRKLLSLQDSTGRIATKKGVYAKWHGAHWVLATLADIGYPAGDPALEPVRDQLLETWLGEQFYMEFEPKSRQQVYSKSGVPVMEGRHRRCASQQGNALWSILKLGLRNERTDDLVERLLHWQWPDGGWNCDKEPSASHSSFTETLLPVRGLSLYAQITGDSKVAAAVERAAEVLLTRHLYRRVTNGKPLAREFVLLHYPLYWHYDYLAGLKVMMEAGFLGDDRCRDAVDMLKERRLPDGGWPAESKYYKVTDVEQLGGEYVDWGGTGKRRMNEWVTADALAVLKAAGQI